MLFAAVSTTLPAAFRLSLLAVMVSVDAWLMLPPVIRLTAPALGMATAALLAS